MYGVPRLSYFYGIAVYVYYEDHPPPHLHTRYGEHKAKVSLTSGEVAEGSLPAPGRPLGRGLGR